MSLERSLLERLAQPKAYASRTLTQNTTEVVRSVLRHLQKMLNSRVGNAPAQMDYGIPDPSEVIHRFPQAIAEMQRAIKACVEKYEPRLNGIIVTHVESEDDILTLRFQITGQITAAKQRIPVVFDTMVDSSGRIRVKD